MDSSGSVLPPAQKEKRVKIQVAWMKLDIIVPHYLKYHPLSDQVERSTKDMDEISAFIAGHTMHVLPRTDRLPPLIEQQVPATLGHVRGRLQ